MDIQSKIAKGRERALGFLQYNKGIYPMLGVFGFSAMLRYALALVNRQANDLHYPVVEIILRESRLPHAGETAESFQPKLFHWAMAQGIRLLGLSNNLDAQTVFMQVCNATAGVIVLLLLFFFLRRLTIPEPVRFWSFALAAFNPNFIAIDAQATNDALVILFVSLAIFASVEFFRTGRFKYYALTVIATIFAGLSKGNGLVILIALLGVWALRMVVEGRKKGNRFILFSGLYLVLWLVAYGLIVPSAGQYIERYKENGSAFYNGDRPNPLPNLYARSTPGRPGVVSFSESYLSFPFVNLVEYPVILSQESDINPANRTSLWAQLYGRANFAHFDQWPWSWRTDNPIVLNIGRCILVLALFPTLAGAFYFFYSAVINLRALFWRGKIEEELWIHTLALGGYILFVAVYAWEYRDFSTMKAIFIFPAMISIVYFIAKGLTALYARIENIIARFAMQAILGSLALLYILDIGYLILQLARDRQWL
jgi:hypothetical protein